MSTCEWLITSENKCALPFEGHGGKTANPSVCVYLHEWLLYQAKNESMSSQLFHSFQNHSPQNRHSLPQRNQNTPVNPQTEKRENHDA